MQPQEIMEALATGGLTVTSAATTRNPFMPGDTSGMSHWFMTVKGRTMEPFDFYYSTSEPGIPDAATAISHLLEDVKLYRGCPGYSDFLAALGIDDDEGRADTKVAWSELERLAPLVEQAFDLDMDQTLVTPGMR